MSGTNGQSKRDAWGGCDGEREKAVRNQKNVYGDIMNLPHHVSSTHPQMPMKDRAAQFSPFAALVGYDDAVREAGRLTDEKTELTEDSLNELNGRFRFLLAHPEEEPEVTITFFKADERKAGGAYIETTGVVRKIDLPERRITMRDGRSIPMDDVCGLRGDFFAGMEAER